MDTIFNGALLNEDDKKRLNFVGQDIIKLIIFIQIISMR